MTHHDEAPFGRGYGGRAYKSEGTKRGGLKRAANYAGTRTPTKWKVEALEAREKAEGVDFEMEAAPARVVDPQQVTLDDETLLVADAARSSLAVYLGLVHRTDDGRQAIPPQHLLDLVIPVIEDDSLGDTLIIAPPGSVKTNTMIGACAWWLGQDPSLHVGYVCNTGPEAVKRSLAVRDVIEQSGEYGVVFPKVKPNKARGWAADNWYLERPNIMDKNPSLVAFGVGGGLGARLHRIVLDDIADEDNQRTENQRQYLWKWMGETIKTRLHPTKGRAILIMTRWHAEDPAAYAIEKGWHVLRIPAVNDAGESYWPEYYPRTWLSCVNDLHNPDGQCCMKKELGVLGFARQYLGVVENEDTAIFKRGWWRRFEKEPEWVRGVISVDTAGWERNDHSDYTVMAAWVTDGVKFYCLEVRRDRWSFNEAVREARAMQADFGLPILVEDVPWARPLIQHLQSVTWGVLPHKPGSRSKENRARAIAPIVESGDVLLPTVGSWVEPFMAEHAVFPYGKNDDQVDTTSMAVGYLNRRRGVTGVRPGKPWVRTMEEVSA